MAVVGMAVMETRRVVVLRVGLMVMAPMGMAMLGVVLELVVMTMGLVGVAMPWVMLIVGFLVMVTTRSMGMIMSAAVGLFHVGYLTGLPECPHIPQSAYSAMEGLNNCRQAPLGAP
jgi:Ni/Fe-hydrogenase subunit HybB-like protein